MKMRSLMIMFLLAWVSILMAEDDAFKAEKTMLLTKNPYHLVSLFQQAQSFTPPEAHPRLEIETFNIDAEHQRFLSLDDLFLDKKKALARLSRYTKTYFMQKLEEEGLDKESYKLREALIQEGTSPTIKNFQHWNVLSNYLRITFDRAQVEPSYFNVQTVDVPLSLFSGLLNLSLFSSAFQLQKGDLLFQDLDCGELCAGINSNDTTSGYQHSLVSHVAIVFSLDEADPMVIEAISQGVVFTPLENFLLRSLDSNNHPRTMVGRGDEKIQALIPKALKKAVSYLHAPYNETFYPEGRGFYCSSLITQIFFESNNQHPIFDLSPMDFRKSHSNHFSSVWIKYFASLHADIPQGKLGSNPGALSKNRHIHIQYFYGKLRTVNYAE